MSCRSVRLLNVSSIKEISVSVRQRTEGHMNESIIRDDDESC